MTVPQKFSWQEMPPGTSDGGHEEDEQALTDTPEFLGALPDAATLFQKGRKSMAWKEMALWLRACTALPADLSSIPSNHIRWLTTVCNSGSRGIQGPWPLQARTHIRQYVHTHN